MKFHLTTRYGVLLIAAVNLSVAVAAFAIQVFTKLDPYCRTPEAVFRFVTFPVLSIAGAECLYGNVMFWEDSVWAMPVFYTLIVLNACIWGVVGVYLFGWFYRTFWIMPERVIPYDEADLKWDAFLVVLSHAVLISILFGIVYFLVPVPFTLLGNFGGPLPFSARLLFQTSIVWRHPVVDLLLAVGFLFADGRTYSWLCRSRGKKAGTIWAIGVTAAIAFAVAWYTVLALVFLNTAIPWRLK